MLVRWNVRLSGKTPDFGLAFGCCTAIMVILSAIMQLNLPGEEFHSGPLFAYGLPEARAPHG